MFGDVDLFTIDIDLDIPLQPGLYDNPTILNVSYRVFGSLEPGTPSGFPQFDLQRNISGAEFYQQGGSLMFEIADNADFSDGIQADELVDNGTILTVFVSEDFTGDVTTATWTQIDANIPSGPSGTFGNFETVGPLNVSCVDGTVNYAFVYSGSDPSATTRYHLDNVEVTGN